MMKLRVKWFMATAAAAAALLGAGAPGGGDFDKTVEAARLALDTSRVEEAAQLFERAGAIAPERIGEIEQDRAWAYIRIGNDALITDDVEKADRSFAVAMAIYPGFKDVIREQWSYTRLYVVNEAITAASKDPRNADWKSIEKDLKWLIELAPKEKDPHYSLGVVYLFKGETEAARREFIAVLGAKAGEGDKSADTLREESAKKLEGRQYSFNLRPVYPPRMKAEPGPFQTLRKGGCVISHHNLDLAVRVAATMKYYRGLPVLDGVLTASDPFPEECKVYIYADEAQFQASGGKEIWAGGQSKMTILDGEVKSATIQLFQTTGELTESAVPHELTHVRLAASPYFYGTMPLWLQEGIASSSESEYKKSLHARVILQAFDDKRLISVEDLVKLAAYPTNNASDVFYAESVAIVESLVEKYGKEPFIEFMSQLQEKSGTEALRNVYGLSTVNVEDMALAWATKRAKQG